MSRPYPYRNLNWRTETPIWEWHELFKGWLSLVEIHRKEETCRIRSGRSTRPDCQ
jgi:hypothetical protein